MKLISIDLSQREQLFLSQGLTTWGGPASCTEELAVAMGFSSVANLLDEGARLSDALRAGAPLSRLDWERTLMATEIVLSCTLLGAQGDWSIVTPFREPETRQLLAEIRPKLVRAIFLQPWAGIGTAPAKDERGGVVGTRRRPGPGGEDSEGDPAAKEREIAVAGWTVLQVRVGLQVELRFGRHRFATNEQG
jgi:hypothetical protein